MTKTIKLARLRDIDYYVNYTDSHSTRSYMWAGSKGNNKVIREVPYEVYEYLLLQTSCFKDGELVIADTETAKVELEENMPELEEYKNNSHSKDEIVKLLKGNVNVMKKELDKVTSITEKRFIKSIADELAESGEGLASTKIAFIEEWIKATTTQE